MELISTVTREIGTGPGVRLHQKVETVTGGYFVARKFVERPPRLRDLVQRLDFPRGGHRQYVTWEIWGDVVEG
jgi:hypothetical protein